jgi:hypothetical protein
VEGDSGSRGRRESESRGTTALADWLGPVAKR